MIGSLFLLLLANGGTAAVAPNPVTLSLTAGSPTVTFAPSGSVVPASVVLGLTAASPTVSFTPASFAVAPAAATLALTAASPTVAFTPATAAVSPAAALLATTATSPTITFAPPGVAAPASVVLALLSTSPAIGFAPLVAPATATLSLFAASPAVSFTAASYSVAPASVTLSSFATSPTINASGIDAHAPITVAQAKAFLKVETTVDDGLIGDLIDAAASYLETTYGLVVAPRAHSFSFEGFARRMPLYRTPVRGVDSIDYFDDAGNDTTIYDWQFRTINGIATVVAGGTALPYCSVGGQATINAQIGWESNADVPADIRLAVQQLVVTWYATREAGEVPDSVRQMLSAYTPIIA